MEGPPADLVGSWRLLRVTASSDSGVDQQPFGASPRGLLVYLEDGTMTALVSYDGRSRLSADRVSAPVEERAEAFTTFFAYAGTYSVAGDQVIHHVEIASVENWVGTDLARTVEFDGHQLVLRTPPLPVGGMLRVTELVWHRAE